MFGDLLSCSYFRVINFGIKDTHLLAGISGSGIAVVRPTKKTPQKKTSHGICK